MLTPLPTMSAREVAAIGERRVPVLRGRSGVQRALEVRPKPNGTADLVDAADGQLVSPCASVAVAERTRDFFR